MQNVNQRIEGNKLIIEVDMSQDFGKSVSGKTLTVASSGFAKVEGDGVPAGMGYKLSVWKGLPKQ